MIENLINLVKQNAGDLIINNQAIANEHNDTAIHETGNAIINGLKQEVAKGNIGGLTDILKSNGNLTNNPIVAGIVSNLGNTLSSKFNVDQANASGIASQLIPLVMNQLVAKTNDPNDDSFNIQGLLNNLGGSGFGGMLVNMFGSSKEDGKSGIGGMFKNIFS